MRDERSRGLLLGLVFRHSTRRAHFMQTPRPDRDRPEAGLLAGYDLRHTDYVEQWDALWALLSREAVAAPRRSERRVALGAPRGALGVGESFLHDLEGWALSSAATY